MSERREGEAPDEAEAGGPAGLEGARVAGTAARDVGEGSAPDGPLVAEMSDAAAGADAGAPTPTGADGGDGAAAAGTPDADPDHASACDALNADLAHDAGARDTPASAVADGSAATVEEVGSSVPVEGAGPPIPDIPPRDACLHPAAATEGTGEGPVAKADEVAGGAEGEPVATAAGEPAVAADAPAPTPDPAALDEALRIAEAVLFATDKPVTAARLQAVLPEGTEAATVLTALAARTAGRGVELVEVAGGFAFRTAADLAPRLTKVVEAPRRLPRAAMEALAVIAYHQPCTRGEIEEIRGASLAQTTLEALLELGLVAPRGKKEAPGRPALWATTPRFLEQFGLKSLNDLPKREELVAPEPTLPFDGAPAAPPATPSPPP
jgi:segregation and condensation protein B